MYLIFEYLRYLGGIFSYLHLIFNDQFNISNRDSVERGYGAIKAPPMELNVEWMFVVLFLIKSLSLLEGVLMEMFPLLELT